MSNPWTKAGEAASTNPKTGITELQRLEYDHQNGRSYADYVVHECELTVKYIESLKPNDLIWLLEIIKTDLGLKQISIYDS